MKKTFSETFESYVNWLVLFVFLTGLAQVLEASAYLVNDITAESLRTWSHWITRAGTVTVIIAMVTWFRRPKPGKNNKNCRSYYNEYVTETVKRSSFIAFVLTFIVIALIDNITNSSELPADFYIKLPAISLAGGFSISFFLYNFMDNTDSSDEEWAE